MAISIQDPAQAPGSSACQFEVNGERQALLTLVPDLKVIPDSEELDFDERLEGIGEVVWVRETSFGDTPGIKDRIRKTGLIEVDGRTHLVRMSLAHPDHTNPEVPTPIDVLFSGLGEMIDAGGSTAKKLHDELALTNPDRDILSIAMAGYSKHGPALSPKEAFFNNGFKNFGSAAGRIVARLSQKQANVTVIPVSMGTVPAFHMARQNLATGQLNIVKVIPVVGCLVGSELHEEAKVCRDGRSDFEHALRTPLEFLGHISVSIASEARADVKGAARNALGAAAILTSMVKSPGKAVAFLGNFANLLPGTSWDTIHEVSSADSCDITFVGAANDPMLQPKQLAKMEELYPGISKVIQEGRGHAMPMDTKLTVALINQARDTRSES